MSDVVVRYVAHYAGEPRNNDSLAKEREKAITFEEDRFGRFSLFCSTFSRRGGELRGRHTLRWRECVPRHPHANIFFRTYFR